LHRLSTTFVLGYHGCDRDVGDSLIDGTPFEESRNEYDWLGWGIYFWEANPIRGLEFANEWKERNGKIKEPYVVGAIIDLGYCLDLTTSAGVRAIRGAHKDFIAYSNKAGSPIPKNSGNDEDKLLRKLDCAVVNHLHHVLQVGRQKPFDSVKGVFIEGGRMYDDSGFYNKTHIQICVRNPECIKGVFRVPDHDLKSGI